MRSDAALAAALRTATAMDGWSSARLPAATSRSLCSPDQPMGGVCGRGLLMVSALFIKCDKAGGGRGRSMGWPPS